MAGHAPCARPTDAASHGADQRPRRKAPPLPMAATVAVERKQYRAGTVDQHATKIDVAALADAEQLLPTPRWQAFQKLERCWRSVIEGPFRLGSRSCANLAEGRRIERPSVITMPRFSGPVAGHSAVPSVWRRVRELNPLASCESPCLADKCLIVRPTLR